MLDKNSSMKKTITLVLFALFTLSTSFGQEQVSDVESTSSYRPAGKPVSSDSRATPFWIEDFGGGFPTDWVIIDSSGICPWTHSYDGTWGYFNGNNGTAGAAPINSTTGANGFMICDPDSANNATYGQPSGSNYQYLSSYFGTSSIDCSGRSSVILSFEQAFRYNNGVDMIVQVSTDSLNWTDFEVSGGQANNAASANPTVVNLNLSTIAANQPDVYLRFGWSARVYYWMIDDISLSEAEPNDVSMIKSWWGTGVYQYQHYKIPSNQLSPLTFYSSINNNTGGSLSGCYSDVDVSGMAGTVYVGSTNSITLPAASFDTVISTSNWTPATIGDYDLTFDAITTAGVDGDLTNNQFVDSMIVTESIYGLDNLTDASQSTGQISNFSSNTGGEFKIGNLYEMTNDDQIECIEIGIADDADNVGQVFYGEVFAYDDATGDWLYRSGTAIVDIFASDIGTIISVPLVAPASVFAGEEILVVAGHYGGVSSGADDVSFMYGQPVEDRMVWGFNATGDAFWLSNPRAIVARADFNCGLGIDEASQNLQIESFPNPATDLVTVQLNGVNTNKCEISIVDLSGKKVLSQQKMQISENGKIDLDVSQLSSGMYQLAVKVAGVRKTTKLIIQ